MAEETLTLEQQRALALANARLRASQGGDVSPQKRRVLSVDSYKMPTDPTEGMSTTEKVLANIGAGMADLGLGVRQLFASDKPDGLGDLVTGDSPKKRLEREAAEKRRMDKQLADSMTGGGALQVAGNILPTLAVPGLPLATNAGRLAIAGAGAAAGAGTGALTPVTEGESRGQNMALGGVVGAALPMALSAGRGVVNAFRSEPRAARELGEALFQPGMGRPEREAVLRQAIQATRTAPPTVVGNTQIPLSMSARLSSPELARLEAGSRARNGANWYDFDQAQARAVADAFQTATEDAAQLAARRGSRSNNWNTNWSAAQQGADASRFAAEIPRLRANLDQAMTSAESSNPAVRSMVQAIADDIDRVTAAGVEYTPGHLQQIRANLSAKFSPLNPNAFTAAPRDSSARLSVMREIDDILNNATGGQWQNVVDTYARDSRLVDAAKAAGKVRSAYYDPQTGRVLGVAADADGAVPKITEAGLGRALNTARGPGGDSLLADPSRQSLEAILAALRQQNIVQGVKRSATAGGGSNTASDMFAARAADAAGDAALAAVGGPAAPVARGGVNFARNLVNVRKDRALAEALQNEQQLVQLLQREAANQRAPLSIEQSEVLRLLRALRGTP